MTEKKIQSEDSNKVPITPEQITTLESAIARLHAELDFGTKAFGGHAKDAGQSLKSLQQELTAALNDVQQPLTIFNKCNAKLETSIQTLSLLPKKTEDVLNALVPEIGKEVEKIHGERMQVIEATLQGLEKSLEKKTESHIEILKALSKQLQKGFNEEVLDQKKSIDQVVNNTIEKIHEFQIEQSKKQEKMFQQLVAHTKKEVDSITTNHGSRFLRNTAICLILAAIAGGVSGWYINAYFPKYVTFQQSGDVTIHDSDVRVWNTEKVKSNLKKK